MAASNTSLWKVSAYAALALLSAGCRTAPFSANEDVAIQVSPEDALVTTDIGMTCTGSCTLNVPRKQSFTVTASAPGYQSQSVQVIGWAVAVGEASRPADHSPNPVILRLQPGSQ